MFATELAIERRAQELLEDSMRTGLEKQPPQTLSHRPLQFNPGGVKLHTLSEAGQEYYRNCARQEMETWLRSGDARAMGKARREAVQSQLHEWYIQKDAAKEAEQRRLEEIEKEREQAAKLDRERWRRRGRTLQKKVGDWYMRKAEREAEEARTAAEEARVKKEREKWSRMKRQSAAERVKSATEAMSEAQGHAARPDPAEVEA